MAKERSYIIEYFLAGEVVKGKAPLYTERMLGFNNLVEVRGMVAEEPEVIMVSLTLDKGAKISKRQRKHVLTPKELKKVLAYEASMEEEEVEEVDESEEVDSDATEDVVEDDEIVEECEDPDCWCHAQSVIIAPPPIDPAEVMALRSAMDEAKCDPDYAVVVNYEAKWDEMTDTGLVVAPAMSAEEAMKLTAHCDGTGDPEPTYEPVACAQPVAEPATEVVPESEVVEPTTVPVPTEEYKCVDPNCWCHLADSVVAPEPAEPIAEPIAEVETGCTGCIGCTDETAVQEPYFEAEYVVHLDTNEMLCACGCDYVIEGGTECIDCNLLRRVARLENIAVLTTDVPEPGLTDKIPVKYQMLAVLVAGMALALLLVHFLG